jgi:hypothetical protein
MTQQKHDHAVDHAWTSKGKAKVGSQRDETKPRQIVGHQTYMLVLDATITPLTPPPSPVTWPSVILCTRALLTNVEDTPRRFRCN